MTKEEEINQQNSCWNKTRRDELMFILLQRDAAALKAIDAWCRERVRLGLNKPDDPQILSAQKCIERMRKE